MELEAICLGYEFYQLLSLIYVQSHRRVIALTLSTLKPKPETNHFLLRAE